MDKNIRVKIIPYYINGYELNAYKDNELKRDVFTGETFWITEKRARELDNIHVIKILEIRKKERGKIKVAITKKNRKKQEKTKRNN